MKQSPYPNIIIVEDNSIEIEVWRRLADKSDIVISVHESPNTAVVQWLHLCSEGFTPRALVCDWNTSAISCFSDERKASTGTRYDIDGVGYVLHACIESVGEDGHGMFVAYSGSIGLVSKEIDTWDKKIKERVNLICKDTMKPQNLLEFIVNHSEYKGQVP